MQYHQPFPFVSLYRIFYGEVLVTQRPIPTLDTCLSAVHFWLFYDDKPNYSYSLWPFRMAEGFPKREFTAWGFPSQWLPRARYHVGLHIKRPLLLSDLKKNWNVMTNVRETPKYFRGNPPDRVRDVRSVHTDGVTSTKTNSSSSWYMILINAVKQWIAGWINKKTNLFEK